MSSDIWALYALMLKSRLFEEAVAKLWHDGLISGEMHLGTGEEAIIAGVVSHLRDGDAMALDHRGTAPLLMRGVDPAAILQELLGRPDGLGRGMGGHMHLFAPDHLAASSGIVGATGPAAAGFGLAAERLRPGSIAVAFFGEGAMNQGMMMEALNLAAVWRLPVLFVCKDDGWSITTRSDRMTGGRLAERSRGLGVPVIEADGLDPCAVFEAAAAAVRRARSGGGPTLLHGRCVHLEGHFLGDQLLRIVRRPLREIPGIVPPMAKAFLKARGAPFGERLKGLHAVASAVVAALRDPRRDPGYDPVARTRKALGSDPARLKALEDGIAADVDATIAAVLGKAEP
jgi:acetoin:2,6-dichlorophenolindophenol oxidoreductase subunit alpha